jgi:hypothetical protein
VRGGTADVGRRVSRWWSRGRCLALTRGTCGRVCSQPRAWAARSPSGVRDPPSTVATKRAVPARCTLSPVMEPRRRASVSRTSARSCCRYGRSRRRSAQSCHHEFAASATRTLAVIRASSRSAALQAAARAPTRRALGMQGARECGGLVGSPLGGQPNRTGARPRRRQRRSPSASEHGASHRPNPRPYAAHPALAPPSALGTRAVRARRDAAGHAEGTRRAAPLDAVIGPPHCAARRPR